MRLAEGVMAEERSKGGDGEEEDEEEEGWEGKAVVNH